MNEWNACAVCGEQVTTRTRIHGFTGWANEDDEIELRETVAVVHPECYMRLSPAERSALLDQAAEDESRNAP